MRLNEAIRFLSPARFHSEPQKWADLGCGNGLFTHALTLRLPDDSKIYGVDKTSQDLSNINSENKEVEFIQADIENSLPFGKLDGIMMANSLHYIKEKQRLLQSLLQEHGPLKSFILIEYDRTHPNPWVPFPLPFAKAKELFSSLNISIKKRGERKSRYGNKSMYLAQYIASDLQ